MTSIPLFWESEIRCGRQLGRGTYCTVTAVKDIVLSKEEEAIPSFQLEDDTTEKIHTSRRRLAHKFAATRHRKVDPNVAIYGRSQAPDDPEEEPAPKLALKRIKKQLLASGSKSKDLKTAQEDFQRELEILQSIAHHANIVDLCGIGFLDQQKQQPTCLILSQIRSTLAQRILRWRDEKGIGLMEAMAWDIANRKNQWVERLVVLSRISHAVQHMHSHRILYRDIKPDNVGFDAVLDVPKLFDFGLAKRIPEDQQEHEEGIFFQLTPNTGTLRYMAMEIGTGKPYGWTADVYSVAILMYEILSLKVPFGGILPTHFRERVWTQGERLPLDPTWPSTILELLPRMWQSNPLERPSMEEVVEVLDTMLRGSDQDLFPTTLTAPRRGFSSLFGA